MTAVTDRPGVLPATVVSEPEAALVVRLSASRSAVPAVALAVVSLLVGSEPSAAEIVRAVPRRLLRSPVPRSPPADATAVWGPSCSAARRSELSARWPTRSSPTTHRRARGGVLVDLLVRLSAALLPAIAMHFLLALRRATSRPGPAPGGGHHVRGRRATGVALMSDRESLDGVADRAALAHRPGRRSGRRSRPLPDSGRHRSPAHAVGRVGDGRRWRGGPRRDRLARPAIRTIRRGRSPSPGLFRLHSSPAPTPGPSPVPTGCSPTPRWPASRPRGRPYAVVVLALGRTPEGSSGPCCCCRWAAASPRPGCPPATGCRTSSTASSTANVAGRVVADVGHPPHPRHPDG